MQRVELEGLLVDLYLPELLRVLKVFLREQTKLLSKQGQILEFSFEVSEILLVRKDE
jgi:hypothetical protein